MVEVEDEVEKDEVEEVAGPTHREKVPIAGMSVEMPLAIAGAWHDEPVCSQIEMGTTPGSTPRCPSRSRSRPTSRRPPSSRR